MKAGPIISDIKMGVFYAHLDGRMLAKHMMWIIFDEYLGMKL